jgi:hypothetical protein
MRLEPLCRMTLRYTSSSWHQPYGDRGDDSEWAGFGQGDGEVTGHVEGAVVWANYPRRRQDGVWTPNARGVIRTNDGEEILLSFRGQSIHEQTETGYHRAILARIELTTQAKPYRWLNTCFVVAEGEIDEETEEIWLDLYVCLNEGALGAEAPEHFRQPARSDSAD